MPVRTEGNTKKEKKRNVDLFFLPLIQEYQPGRERKEQSCQVAHFMSKYPSCDSATKSCSSVANSLIVLTRNAKQLSFFLLLSHTVNIKLKIGSLPLFFTCRSNRPSKNTQMLN